MGGFVNRTKSAALACLLLFHLLFITRIAESKTINNRKALLSILEKYSPDSYWIIKNYESTPTRYVIGNSTITLSPVTDFMTYITSYDANDAIEELTTAVHEICHGFTSKYAYSLLNDERLQEIGGYLAITIQNDSTLLVRKTAAFPSSKISNMIPESCRTARYDTYITANEERLGTQINGIYGLLDELTAYYHGTRTAVDLYGYYKKELKTCGQKWLDFFSCVDGQYFAYGEFKLFILEYLIYAKEHEPDIYSGIIDNAGFCRALVAIDQKYSSLIERYDSLKKDILHELDNERYIVSEDEEWTYIGTSVASKGQGNFKSTFHILMNEIAKPELQEMWKTLETGS
jgi:hypothetical protein